MKLLTVGTVAFDTVESPYGKVERTVAGSCMYSAWSASFFIQSVGMISIIGDDASAAQSPSTGMADTTPI